MTLLVKPAHGSQTIVAYASAHAGVGKINWNGQLHGKKVRHGTYQLILTATVGKQTAASTLSVRI
jgi:hypothetical protein